MIRCCLLCSLALLLPLAAAAQTGPDPRLDVLRHALERGPAAVRFQAIRTAGSLKEKAMQRQLVPLLAARLTDRETLVRIEALQTLGRIKLPEAARALIAALDHNAVGIRYLAAQLLGRRADPAALQPLQKRLLDISPMVRREAMAAIRLILLKIDQQRRALSAD